MNELTREVLLDLIDVFSGYSKFKNPDERTLEFLAEDIEDALINHNLVVVTPDE